MLMSTAQSPSRPLGLPSLMDVLVRFSVNNLLCNDAGIVFKYGDVITLAQSAIFRATRRRLVMCRVNNDIEGIAGYLALLAANAVPMMVSPTLPPASFDKLIATYQPEYLWLPHQDSSHWRSSDRLTSLGSYELIGLNNSIDAPALHENLALLLSTSGSTGTAKYVRLSHQNVWSNAAAIADYMALSADEIPVTTLPPSYSFGLSIINSHIWVGAEIAVTHKSFFDRNFWNFLRDSKVTSLSGVPYHFEILKKLRFTNIALPHIRTLTQAGGRMSLEINQEYAAYCQSKGMRFFTMYGQTEASPRISYVPAEQAYTKAGTIGVPIPGGVIELQSETGGLITEANCMGEMVYRGPNVCLGYAECRADLALGDVNCGVLQTGDLALRDEDGFYKIVGRQKRFIKLFGNRVNLQEVELHLSSYEVDIACSGQDDLLKVYLILGSEDKALKIKKELMAYLRIGAQCVAVFQIDEMPRNESGKVLYSELDYAKTRRLA
jgi:long-chain acyl-CoA synthetase